MRPGPVALVSLAAAVAVAGCRAATEPTRRVAVSAALASDLALVRGQRVLFLHHSVGVNVLAGIQALDGEAGSGLRVLELPPDESIPDGAGILHAGVGKNGDPASKIDGFAALLRGRSFGPGLALMKLCYVDIDPRTDVGAVFERYARTVEALRRELPDVRLAHVTTPLERRPTDLKSRVRRLLGLPVWVDASNAKRAEYNRRLLERFAADPVFDLAAAESTAEDGSRSLDAGVPSLRGEYTDDGGHLNARGQRHVAAAAIRFLAAAARGEGL